MSVIHITPHYLTAFNPLDATIKQLNDEKVRLLFKMLGIKAKGADLERLLEWELILVTVPDRQMAVQLNKLSAYVPNLKFEVDPGTDLFSIKQGIKKRRVWKER